MLRPMKLQSQLAVHTAVGFFTFFLFLLPGRIEAQSPIRVRAAYSAMSAAMAPLWYAQDTKLSDKFKLQVELLYIQGQPVALPGAHHKRNRRLIDQRG